MSLYVYCDKFPEETWTIYRWRIYISIMNNWYVIWRCLHSIYGCVDIKYSASCSTQFNFGSHQHDLMTPGEIVDVALDGPRCQSYVWVNSSGRLCWPYEQITWTGSTVCADVDHLSRMSRMSGYHPCFVFGSSRIKISTRRPPVLTEIFRGIAF